MTYTANNPQPGSVHRDGVAIAFTRGPSGEAEAEARRIAAALTAAETGPLSSFDYELIADALDVLDPDGSEARNRTQELEAWARAMAATGRGYLPPLDPARELAADVLAIDRDDDGDAMLDAQGLDELQEKARTITGEQLTESARDPLPHVEPNADLREASAGYFCRACGREEADCSAEPCEAVLADREA